MIRHAIRRGFLALCAAILLTAGAAAQPTRSAPPFGSGFGLQQVLSWLPSDTETIIVAKDFVLADFERLEEYPELRNQETAFQSMALGPWRLKNGSLKTYFKNHRVLLAIGGARRFRSPKGLGSMLFEGCTVLVFADDLGSRADLFVNAASKDALKVEDVVGHRILMFGERSESDIWRTFIGFIKPNVLLMGTDIEYIREALSSIEGKRGPRALPETLPHWKYVDTSAQFWGLRHFDQMQRDRDPSSPFWNPRRVVKSPWTDEQAIGLTFNFDPASRKGPAVTYLSKNPRLGKKALEMRHEGTDFRVVYRELNGVALQASYSVEQQTSGMFAYFLSFLLGHAVFL